MNLANLFLGAEIPVFVGGFWKPFMVKSLTVSRCRPNQSCFLQLRRIPPVPEAHTLIFLRLWSVISHVFMWKSVLTWSSCTTVTSIGRFLQPRESNLSCFSLPSCDRTHVWRCLLCSHSNIIPVSVEPGTNKKTQGLVRACSDWTWMHRSFGGELLQHITVPLKRASKTTHLNICGGVIAGGRLRTLKCLAPFTEYYGLSWDVDVATVRWLTHSWLASCLRRRRRRRRNKWRLTWSHNSRRAPSPVSMWAALDTHLVLGSEC